MESISLFGEGSVTAATMANECWAMDFVHGQLMNGTRFRALTVVDTFTPERAVVSADTSFGGKKVAAALDALPTGRGYPRIITIENGSEFYSKERDAWAYRRGVRLDFIRPGKLVENGFNVRLRDELPNAELLPNELAKRSSRFPAADWTTFGEGSRPCRLRSSSPFETVRRRTPFPRTQKRKRPEGRYLRASEAGGVYGT